MKTEQGITRQPLATPEVARLQVLETSGRARRTQWFRAHAPEESIPGRVPPLMVTVDHVHADVPELRRVVEGLGSGGLTIQVHLHYVREDVQAIIAEATPDPLVGYGSRRKGDVELTLGLDLWLPENDRAAMRQGYTCQHWLFTRLVTALEKPAPGGELPHGDGEVIAEPFASAIALEDPRRATHPDLWWPTYAPPPVRAYQWVREDRYPPVPV